MGVRFSDDKTTVPSTVPSTTATSRNDSEMSLATARNAKRSSPPDLDYESFSRSVWNDIGHLRRQELASSKSRTANSNGRSSKHHNLSSYSRGSSPPPDSSSDESLSRYSRQGTSRPSGPKTSYTTRTDTRGRTAQNTDTQRTSQTRNSVSHQSSHPQSNRAPGSYSQSTSGAQPASQSKHSRRTTVDATTAQTGTVTATSRVGTGRWLLNGAVSTGWEASKVTASALGAMGRSLAESAFGSRVSNTDQDTQTNTARNTRIGAFPSVESSSTGVSVVPYSGTITGTNMSQTTGTAGTGLAATGTVATGTAATGQKVSRWRRHFRKGDPTDRTDASNTTAATGRRHKGLKRAALATLLGRTSALQSFMTRQSSASRRLDGLTDGSTSFSGRDTRRHGMFFDSDTIAKLTGATNTTPDTAASVSRRTWFSSRRNQTKASSVAPTGTSVAVTGTCTCNHSTAKSRNPFRRGFRRKPAAQTSLELMRAAKAANTAATEPSWFSQSYWTGQSAQEATAQTDTAVSVAPRRSLASRLTGQSAPTNTELSIVPSAAVDTAASQSYAGTVLSAAGTVLSTGLGVTWGIGCATASAVWAGGQSVYDRYNKCAPPDIKTAQPLAKGGLKSTLKSINPERSPTSAGTELPLMRKKSVQFG